MDLEERLERMMRADGRRYELRSIAVRPQRRVWSYGIRAAELTAAIAAALVLSVVVLSARGQVGSAPTSPSPSSTSAVVVPSSSASASATPSSAPSAVVVTPTSSPAVTCATGTGGLQVCPARGPVGTVVTLSDRNWGCTGGRSGFNVILVFEGHPESGAGTEGGLSLPEIKPDANGAFQTTFAIPATLDPFHGQGGGPTRPGTYAFVGRPPDCMVSFVVTP